MLIFPKKDVNPIIVPQICFKDKLHNANSFSEMNPSIFIQTDGKITILVRCVNYSKFYDKKYTVHSANASSLYYILDGNIKGDEKLNVENFEYRIINVKYNLPTFPTYWFGLEDIRFITSNTMLVNVPNLNESGNPSIFKAELNNNVINNFTHCKPNVIEKNWMPYFDKDCFKVIYSLSPFLIKSIENDDCQEIPISELIKHKLKGFHGSTNGISFIEDLDEKLFLIHVNKERIYHRWLKYNVTTHNVQASEEFVFFKNTYIEFACSLSIFENRIFISLGANDDKAYIIETCAKDVMEIFSKNVVSKYPTIVTMLYDIRRLEKSQIERNRKIDSYINFSKQFLMRLPFPIVFFIDDNEETYNKIYNFRKELGLLDETYIYKNDLQNTFFYKHHSRLEHLQTQFQILNGEIQHETPLYVILNNNKFDCIDKTIELNPFKSSHFIWMDIGINHVAENVEKIYDWIDKVPDKIKQQCINPYTENVSPKQYFQMIYHNMAGGLFSGSLENMKKYSELFKKKTEEIYNENWYQIDEAVMTLVHRDNPDLFELFYGDYQGIVSNYQTPIHNIELILKACQKYLDYNRNKEAYDTLRYCLPYFLNNSENGLAFYFIELNLKTNFINNNNLLLEEIIRLINLKKNSVNKWQQDLIYNILENYKVYINCYENKDVFA